MKKTLFIFVTFLSFSCANPKNDAVQKTEPEAFDVTALKPLLIENGKRWGEALKTKDASIFMDLYDVNAHYLPNGDIALNGNTAIMEYWKAYMSFLTDIQLEMETLEGNKQLVYETGKGLALVFNQTGGIDTLRYKYVNVWKQGADGKYRVVIDIYNDIKAP